MSNIQLGAKLIADPSKADAGLKYEFIPDVNVPDAKGNKVSNLSLGKEGGIWFVKKHLTSGDKSKLNMRVNRDSSMSIPMTETWQMTVLEIHGLYNGDKEVTPDDVRNAVGSTLADALLVENYHDSFNRSELTEDEVKN